MSKIKEKHPDWYHDVPQMRTLILGTYPPVSHRWSYEFYYPNKINRFWKILARIAETTLSNLDDKDKAKKERIAIMEKLQVGVQNLGKTIEREDGCASDNKIKILDYQDILTIIKKARYLENILLAGYSGKTNTYKDFLKYLDKHEIHYSIPKKIKAGDNFPIMVGEKVINVIVGNSTSTNAFKVSDDMLYRQFKEAIIE